MVDVPVGTVNKPSMFFARLIQATGGKAAQRFAFSTVAAVSTGFSGLRLS